MQDIVICRSTGRRMWRGRFAISARCHKPQAADGFEFTPNFAGQFTDQGAETRLAVWLAVEPYIPFNALTTLPPPPSPYVK